MKYELFVVKYFHSEELSIYARNETCCGATAYEGEALGSTRGLPQFTLGFVFACE
jgi:hypothetical protein